MKQRKWLCVKTEDGDFTVGKIYYSKMDRLTGNDGIEWVSDIYSIMKHTDYQFRELNFQDYLKQIEML